MFGFKKKKVDVVKKKIVKDNKKTKNVKKTPKKEALKKEKKVVKKSLSGKAEKEVFKKKSPMKERKIVKGGEISKINGATKIKEIRESKNVCKKDKSGLSSECQSKDRKIKDFNVKESTQPTAKEKFLQPHKSVEKQSNRVLTAEGWERSQRK